MSDLYIYTSDQVQEVIFSGSRVAITKSIIDMINNLDSLVSSPSYVRTPNFKKGHSEYKEWDNIRKFKTTCIIKIENNMDSILSDIRQYLNKLTEKNFLSISGDIVSKIGSTMSSEELQKVSQMIFKVSSQNRFMSLAYARLYMLLMEPYPTMGDICNKSFDSFMDVFNNIRYISPEEDYDEYCSINKTNEMRKALGAFFVNLMGIGVIHPDKLAVIVIKLQESVFDNASLFDKRKIIDEIGETIFLIVTLGKEKLSTSCHWDTILGNITNVQHINKKEFRGITSKTIFKHADIIDCLNT